MYIDSIKLKYNIGLYDIEYVDLDLLLSLVLGLDTTTFQIYKTHIINLDLWGGLYNALYERV